VAAVIKNYFSLIKFSHTIFAMPFAMVGYFLGINQPGFLFDWKILLFVVLCMIFARSAAMAFNRIVDLRFDLKNPRTITREIPAGKISVFSGTLFVLISSLLFIVTTFFINRLVFYLSPVALIVIFTYSYTKRFTSLCHFVLGLGLALAPIGAYLSVTSRFDILPIIFSVIVLLWVGGFDIIYALQDDEFDKSLNLHSVPVKLGRKNALILSALAHLIAVALIVIAGLYWPFGWIFWLGAVVFTLMLIYEHFIVKPGDLSKVNMAFAVVNGFAGLVFGVLVIASLYQ
jgi:4-hydroxybenzoate polyprenyltransferase